MFQRACVSHRSDAVRIPFQSYYNPYGNRTYQHPNERFGIKKQGKEVHRVKKHHIFAAKKRRVERFESLATTEKNAKTHFLSAF